MKSFVEWVWECAVTAVCSFTVMLCAICITHEATWMHRLDSLSKKLETAEQTIAELQDKLVLVEGRTDILWDVR